MEIDKEQYKNFLRQAFGTAKAMEHQLMIYRHLVKKLRRLHPDLPVDRFLGESRANAAMLEALDHKYDPYLAKILDAVDQTSDRQKLEELLRSWKPESGLEN